MILFRKKSSRIRLKDREKVEIMFGQNIRLYLLSAIVLVGVLLYTNWQQDHADLKSNNAAESKEGIPAPTAQQKMAKDIPVSAESTEAKTKEKEATGEFNIPSNRLVTVETDVMKMTIDKMGGDVVELLLPVYASEYDKSASDGYVLFDHTDKRYYVAQSGLASKDGPDIYGVGRAEFTTAKSHYALNSGDDGLTVEFKTETSQGVEIIKQFSFDRHSYVVTVSYIIDNHSSKPYTANFYGRLKRKPETSSSGFFGVQTYTGAALHTPETPYQKISFKDINDKPIKLELDNGWAAMVEHYFVSAWILDKSARSTYQTAHNAEADLYSIGFVENAITVEPKQKSVVKARLYAGPQITENLKAIAPGLELAVDYGILWPICQPIFWVMKKLHDFLGNWGWAIVAVTVIIKLLFYHLSAKSYRSMARLRELQPKMEALKERYGEDKQKFSQAVMELYRKEKINPLGGCLPILVQIPVFIALYYVLLGSVELRQADFIFWLTDLSAKDPYYVLPILMGLSMIIQQKLSPPPADPAQAKVMMIMPVVFTVLFVNFPSGLVLYWLVNNILSIAQQWFIMRSVAAHSAAKKLEHGNS